MKHTCKQSTENHDCPACQEARESFARLDDKAFRVAYNVPEKRLVKEVDPTREQIHASCQSMAYDCMLRSSMYEGV